MDIRDKLLAEISSALRAMQLQLDYARASIITSLGGEPVFYSSATRANVYGNGADTLLRVGYNSTVSNRVDIQSQSAQSNITSYNDNTSVYTPLNINAEKVKLSSYFELVEISSPGTPATNSVYLFAVDNGSGKTVLYAKFASGIVQLAIEP